MLVRIPQTHVTPKNRIVHHLPPHKLYAAILAVLPTLKFNTFKTSAETYFTLYINALLYNMWVQKWKCIQENFYQAKKA